MEEQRLEDEKKALATNNPLMDRMRKDELAKGKKDFLHSSIYAKAQNGGGIGVASTESFEQRKDMERNRSTIQGYRDSLIAERRPNTEELRSRLQRKADAGQNGQGGSQQRDSGQGNSLYRAAEARAEREARFAPKRSFGEAGQTGADQGKKANDTGAVGGLRATGRTAGNSGASTAQRRTAGASGAAGGLRTAQQGRIGGISGPMRGGAFGGSRLTPPPRRLPGI